MDKDLKRWQAANEAAKAVAAAALIAAQRQLIVCECCMCRYKATYGWILRAPTKKTQRSAWKSCSKCGFCTHSGFAPPCEASARSLSGLYMSGQAAFCTWVRSIKLRQVLPSIRLATFVP